MGILNTVLVLTKTTPGGLATHWGLGRGLGTQYKDAATPITQSTCDANQPFLSFINVTGAEAALLANVRRRLCGDVWLAGARNRGGV